MTINVILPHIRKFGGVRRYLEFGNALHKIDKTIIYNLWLIDYNTNYDWIKELNFRGNIRDIKQLSNYKFNNKDKNIVICGDATSLGHIENFQNCDLKIINIIFPLNSGYILGDYSKYLKINDGKTIVVGNSTGWDNSITSMSNYFTIPGAVNLSMFKPINIHKNNDSFSVLFMAKNRPWKGYDKLFNLVNIVKNSTDKINFSYFDTERHPKFDELGVRSYINLPQAKMYDIYNQHDCFLSFEELAGWQNTVAEAMACQVPVITTQIGTTDIAFDKKTALILKKIHNKEKLVHEALTYIFLLKSNPKLSFQLKNAAYEQIKQFSWEKYAVNYLNLINNCLGSKIEPEIIKPVEVTQPEIIDKSSSANIEKESIKNKTVVLKKYLEKHYNSKKSLIFDKYQKYGAYQWNSDHDKPYHIYLNYLKQSFKALIEFYGNEYTLADLGGGDGFTSYNLQEYVKKIDIFEINKSTVELASQKIQNNNKIKIYNQDFFTVDLSKYDIILLSKIVEHFENPQSIISNLQKYNTKIIIITTPLAKKDKTMWDQNYHFHEFFRDDLLNLVKPLQDNYIISLSVLEPYNQILVLENKQNTLNNYIDNIFFNPDFKPELKMKNDIVSSILTMIDNKPKINYMNPQVEVK